MCCHKGFVQKSDIMVLVGQCLTIMSPDVICSFTKKYLMSMCLVHYWWIPFHPLLTILHFFLINDVSALLLQSWKGPYSLLYGLIHSNEFNFVESFVIHFCQINVEYSDPPPTTTTPPVWLLISWWVANVASTCQLISSVLYSDSLSERSGVLQKYLITHNSFLLSSWSGLLTLVVTKATAVWMFGQNKVLALRDGKAVHLIHVGM